MRRTSIFLATVHRQENADDPERFGGIVKGLQRVGGAFATQVIYPIHPRAKKNLGEFGLTPIGLRIIEPLDYLSFLRLESKARLVFTDSGGVQEETCILKVPCVTLRDNAERPETLDASANVLAGTDPDEIVKMAKIMIIKDRNWENPFGDGAVSSKIMLRREVD